VRAVLVAALSFGVVVAGCGNSGPRLSKASFDAHANSICRTYTAKIAAVPPPKNISQVSAYVDTVKPYIARAVDEIAHLKPPAALRSAYDLWLESQRTALKQADELRAAAEKNDLVEVNNMIKSINEQNTRGKRLAAPLGASVCSKG
jgi:nitrous oxide reductase accessory protein NosL